MFDYVLGNTHLTYNCSLEIFFLRVIMMADELDSEFVETGGTNDGLCQALY